MGVYRVILDDGEDVMQSFELKFQNETTLLISNNYLLKNTVMSLNSKNEDVFRVEIPWYDQIVDDYIDPVLLLCCPNVRWIHRTKVLSLIRYAIWAIRPDGKT